MNGCELGADARPTAGESIGIVGGGIAGLTAAYRLARAGCDVTLFEASDQFGGLGTYFEYEGKSLDRFYHVMLPTDEALLALVESLGLANDVYWKESSLGFMYDRRMYPLAGPLDLLRFDPVPFFDRLRLGATALWAAHVARPEPLDRITVEEWLTRLSGRRAFDRLWKPLLEAKFGDAYGQIPALWYWGHFRREKGTGKEVKGYMKGGYRALAEALIREARARGAELRTAIPVEAIEPATTPPDGGDAPGVSIRTGTGSERFDRVLLCTPYSAVRELMADEDLDLASAARPGEVDFQGVVNVLVRLGKPLTPHYWIPVVECGTPFRGIVETTRVLDPADAGDAHLVYLLNYVHRETAEFQRSDEDLAADYVAGLLDLFPDIDASDILSTHVFRAPFVEPLWSVGYAGRIPPVELVPGRVYLATTAQAYPRVTSWNTSIELAETVTRRMLEGASRN